jgi:hypothetical protein
MKARPSDGRDIPLDRAGESGPLREAGIIKRLALAAATAFVAVNIWTGCPIFALWVGAQVVSERRVTVSVFASAVALSWLNATYDAMTGRQHVERRPAWMRSMNAETESHVHKRVGITPIEQVVMLNVYVVVILLAVWYVFFAGPPLLHN